MTLQENRNVNKASREFELEELGKRWLELKDIEDTAKADRRKIEKRIEEIADINGTQTVKMDSPSYRIKVTGKVTTSLDQTVAAEIVADLPDEQTALKQTYKLDKRGKDELEKYFPEAAAILRRAITTKPAQTAFEIKELNNGNETNDQ